MTARRLLFFVLPAVALSLGTASAGIVWEQQEIVMNADPLAEKADAVFAFTVTGEKPVTITRLHSTCGCTVANLEKRTYQPGEKGEIGAVFSFEGRTGRQSKSIQVDTDDPSAPHAELVITVDIPTLFKVSAYFVMWKVGDSAESKSVLIRSLHPDLIVPVAVEARDTHFTCTLEPEADSPGAFRVVVTPSDTAKNRQAAIIVRTNAPGETPRSITLYALIR